jgi:hypothetical protein
VAGQEEGGVRLAAHMAGGATDPRTPRRIAQDVGGAEREVAERDQKALPAALALDGEDLARRLERRLPEVGAGRQQPGVAG